MVSRALSFLPAATALCAADTADIIYHNGKIVTLWDSNPIAQAVAIHGNRSLAVGSNTDVLKTAGAAIKRCTQSGDDLDRWTFSGSGTELMCARGHGLLHVSEITTSYSTQRWLYLDQSWAGLFSLKGGAIR